MPMPATATMPSATTDARHRRVDLEVPQRPPARRDARGPATAATADPDEPRRHWSRPTAPPLGARARPRRGAEPPATTSTTKPAGDVEAGSPSIRPRKTMARADAEARGAAVATAGHPQAEAAPPRRWRRRRRRRCASARASWVSSVSPDPVERCGEDGDADGQDRPGARAGGPAGSSRRHEDDPGAQRDSACSSAREQVITTGGRASEQGHASSLVDQHAVRGAHLGEQVVLVSQADDEGRRR